VSFQFKTNPKYQTGTVVLSRIFTNRSKLNMKFSITPKIILDKNHPIYSVEDVITKTISKLHVSDIKQLLLDLNN